MLAKDTRLRPPRFEGGRHTGRLDRQGYGRVHEPRRAGDTPHGGAGSGSGRPSAPCFRSRRQAAACAVRDRRARTRQDQPGRDFLYEGWRPTGERAASPGALVPSDWRGRGLPANPRRAGQPAPGQRRGARGRRGEKMLAPPVCAAGNPGGGRPVPLGARVAGGEAKGLRRRRRKRELVGVFLDELSRPATPGESGRHPRAESLECRYAGRQVRRSAGRGALLLVLNYRRRTCEGQHPFGPLSGAAGAGSLPRGRLPFLAGTDLDR